MSFTLTLPEDNALILNAMSRALAEIAQGCTVAVGVVEPVQYEYTQQPVEQGDTPVDLDIEPVEAGEPVDTPLPDLDKDGFPWDNRINPTPASVTASGVWKMRRKPKDMDDSEWSDYIDTVRNELTNLMSIEVESDDLDSGDIVEHVISDSPVVDSAEVIPPPVMTVKVEELKPVTAGDVFGETALTPPCTSIEPPIAPPPTITTFPQLMTWLTGMTGKITVEQVNGALAEWNMNSVALLAKRPDLIPVFVAKIEALL